MKILSIETSCDETAVSIVEAEGDLNTPSFTVLGNALFSQIAFHAPHGGVVPNVAKREHARNLSPLLLEALTQAEMLKKLLKKIEINKEYSENIWREIEKILIKEEGLYVELRECFECMQKPQVDMIAVTSGPGLEPALWVGISFAQALGKLWEIPVVPVNHMEGHIASVLLEKTEYQDKKNNEHSPITFPALALLISGGHTELVAIKNWGDYAIVGQTRDDAVGEAFDKVGRLLDLPYPGGPKISLLAEKARRENLAHIAILPRPMLHSHDLDFSFSGLKTAVLYYIRDYVQKNGPLKENEKADIAREFEDSVVDVLLQKTKKAVDHVGAETLIIAGGVIANTKIRDTFEKNFGNYANNKSSEFATVTLHIPTRTMATDNSVMIACAGYIQISLNPELLTDPMEDIVARGNLKLEARQSTQE